MFSIILLSTRVFKSKLEVQTIVLNFYLPVKLLFLLTCSHLKIYLIPFSILSYSTSRSTNISLKLSCRRILCTFLGSSQDFTDRNDLKNVTNMQVAKLLLFVTWLYKVMKTAETEKWEFKRLSDLAFRCLVVMLDVR